MFIKINIIIIIILNLLIIILKCIPLQQFVAHMKQSQQLANDNIIV